MQTCIEVVGRCLRGVGRVGGVGIGEIVKMCILVVEGVGGMEWLI